MARIYCTLTFFFLSIACFAQSGQVEIIRDPKLDILVKRQGLPIPPATSPQINGYRLQIFFDTDRKSVESARAKFIAMHPKIDTYMIYNAPNYILKVGDLRSSYEAERLKSNVVSTFPTAFVVKEKVNLPRID